MVRRNNHRDGKEAVCETALMIDRCLDYLGSSRTTTMILKTEGARRHYEGRKSNETYLTWGENKVNCNTIIPTYQRIGRYPCQSHPRLARSRNSFSVYFLSFLPSFYWGHLPGQVGRYLGKRRDRQNWNDFQNRQVPELYFQFSRRQRGRRKGGRETRDTHVIKSSCHSTTIGQVQYHSSGGQKK